MWACVCVFHLHSASDSPASAFLRPPSNHLPSPPPPSVSGLPVGFSLAAAQGWRPLITRSPTGVCKDFLSRLNYHTRQVVITQSLIYSGENCTEIVTEIARTRNTVHINSDLLGLVEIDTCRIYGIWVFHWVNANPMPDCLAMASLVFLKGSLICSYIAQQIYISCVSIRQWNHSCDKDPSVLNSTV